MINSELDIFSEISISIIGPSSSGKTWLLKSLSKELEYYNRINEDFYFLLSQTTGFSVPRTVPDVLPTDKLLEDEILMFQRKKRKNTYAHEISSFTHLIRLTDSKGDPSMAWLRDMDNSNVEQINTIIELSDCVVLTLPAPENTNNRFYSGEYSQFCDNLIVRLSQFSKKNKKKMYFALCITKSDLLDQKRTAYKHLDINFPSFSEVIIRQKALLEDFQYLDIGVFKTSAFGFYVNNGVEKSNSESSEILHKERWEPINVIAPFFWFFENIEKSMLQRNKKKLFSRSPSEAYLKYPCQREF